MVLAGHENFFFVFGFMKLPCSPFQCHVTNHANSGECFVLPLWRSIKHSSRAGGGQENIEEDT